MCNALWRCDCLKLGRYTDSYSSFNSNSNHVYVCVYALIQHGQPLQVIDMGETAIDEETFNDYINEMNDVYTADKVCYCPFFFNCLMYTLLDD